MTNDQIIRMADRYAPSNPPKTAPCWKCHNEGRVKVNRDTLREYYQSRIGWYGCRWAINIIKGWDEDGKIPCGEHDFVL